MNSLSITPFKSFECAVGKPKRRQSQATKLKPRPDLLARDHDGAHWVLYGQRVYIKLVLEVPEDLRPSNVDIVITASPSTMTFQVCMRIWSCVALSTKGVQPNDNPALQLDLTGR